MADDIRARLDSITSRVTELESGAASVTAALVVAEKRISDVADAQRQIAEGQRELAADLAAVKETLGSAPNEATGNPGSGMAAKVAEMNVYLRDQAKKPADFLRRVQTISAVLGTIVVLGTIAAGCGTALVWLVKNLHRLGDVP